MKFQINKVDECYCRIIGPIDLLGSLEDFLSIPVDNFWFNPKYKMGIWDGKIRFLNKGRILIGLLPIVIQYFKDHNYPFELDPGISFTPLKIDIKHFLNVTKKSFKENFIPNTHQMRGAYLAICNRRGILSHCTSSGKTFTAWVILNFLLNQGHIKNALIIVPRTSLVEQSVKEFISYGCDPNEIGRFYGEVKEPNKTIIVSTWQSLKNENPTTNEILNSTEGFILDECHSGKAAAVKKVLERCKNAKWRLGVTGTMPDNRADLYTIKGLTGEILDRVKSKELQEKGIISKLKLKILFLSYKDKSLFNNIEDFIQERDTLELNEKRNHMINVLANNYIKKGKNVLVLYEHKKHGDLLEEGIDDSDCSKVFRIDGSVATKEREIAREYANQNDNTLILASYGVYSTGVNIKNLHVIIFASAGKAKIRLLQSIGRGLRKHPNKNHLLLFDIADDFKYSKKHLEKRLEYYSNEEYDIDMSEIKI